MERAFPKDMASLQEVFRFLDVCFAAHHADRNSSSVIALAVEELFTNMVRHAPEGREDIKITITSRGNTLVVTLVDSNVEPFAITRMAEVDTSVPLEQRKVGGLGIHLVKRLVENLTYSYADRNSTITFSKTLET
jgi:anti-sigma regulatory factor (Ser/Thr protein kinase)